MIGWGPQRPNPPQHQVHYVLRNVELLNFRRSKIQALGSIKGDELFLIEALQEHIDKEWIAPRFSCTEGGERCRA